MAERICVQIYVQANAATRIRLQLQAACFDAYVGGWKYEERELTSQSTSPLRSNEVVWVVKFFEGGGPWSNSKVSYIGCPKSFARFYINNNCKLK